MFAPNVYIERRKKLKELVKSGVLIFVGNTELPMNYPQNIYHFRQDSSFLYFFGIDEPGLAAVIDIDKGKEIIFGNDVEIEDVVLHLVGIFLDSESDGLLIGNLVSKSEL